MTGARSTAQLGGALLLAAALFDAEPLYVAGAAFCLLAAVCVAWVLSGASGLTIERRLGAPKVEEDRPLAVEIVLTGARVALPTCDVEDPLLDEPARLRGGRRSVTLPVEARFPHRGRRWIDPPRAVLRDPLGLAERVVSGRGRDEILVLPRVEPILAAADGDGAQG